MPRSILVSVRDLLFGSKIQTAAARTGTLVSWAPRDRPLAEVLREQRPDVLLADLAQEGVLDEVRQARAERPELRVIGWAGHTEGALLEMAREAGVRVVVRGRFAADLDRILVAERDGRD